MKTPDLFDSPAPQRRAVMNGKPVFDIPAKSVLNLNSAFAHKLLCDGSTMSLGSACAYSCSYCYVPDLMRKSPHRVDGQRHSEIVMRRANALGILHSQLVDRYGRPRFSDPADRRVIYASPLVDVAANIELANETVEACQLVLSLTNWQVRLLSKSTFLPHIAVELDLIEPAWKFRVIYGVSTGTLEDDLSAAYELCTPRPSKRIESLHWLQDQGFRTFGMICPSLPLPDGDYARFASECALALRAQRCEHVWGEVLNVRGESMTLTIDALRRGGFTREAEALCEVSLDPVAWEDYARNTFEAHAAVYAGTGKLRFLQYVSAGTRPWWQQRVCEGAILL